MSTVMIEQDNSNCPSGDHITPSPIIVNGKTYTSGTAALKAYIMMLQTTDQT